MIPIVLLREGITQGDWKKVCTAYANLTGEQLEPPLNTVAPKVMATLSEIRDLASRALGIDTAMVAKPEPEPERSLIVLPGESAPPPAAQEETPPDFVLKKDIEGEGPSERIVERPTGEKNCYDVPIKLVSQAGSTITPGEVRRNQERAERASQRKQHREPPTDHEIVCTGCQRTFKSSRPPIKGIGQKCPGCMRAAREARGD